MCYVSTTKWFVLLALLAAAQAQTYDDYEDDDRPIRPAPPRIKSGYSGPAGPKPTPTPILKQINRHNEDGSYTYGYEGADGSFKIETKLATGEVKGKYGYVDDTGKVRIVEYGATKYGFEPAGEGITVPPPTLVDESKTEPQDEDYPNGNNQYYQPAPRPQPQTAAPRPRPRPRPRPEPQQQQEYETFQPQQFVPNPVPAASLGPVPPRRPPQIPGAVPSSYSSDLDFGPPRARASSVPIPSRPVPLRPQQFQQPAPIEEEPQEYQPEPPRPKITYRPAPVSFPAPRPAPSRPQYAPRPGPVPRPGGGGVLDQLAKDYALPQDGAAPLHDISFGYY